VKTQDEDLIERIAIAYEVCGGVKNSSGAAQVIFNTLKKYPYAAVCAALERCISEVPRLSLAEIIKRIDDGRPGTEEAWGMIPKSEHETVVWTHEMSTAYGACHRLIKSGDFIAARKSFIEAYQRLLVAARAKKTSVKWTVSPGTDKSHQDGIVKQALAAGKIDTETARQYLIDPDTSIAEITGRIGYTPKMLED
jgi:hypothetical protein